jgi:hypothetical protein
MNSFSNGDKILLIASSVAPPLLTGMGEGVAAAGDTVGTYKGGGGAIAGAKFSTATTSQSSAASVSISADVAGNAGASSQGKKYRPVESEISEIFRLSARSEIFPLSSEIFIFLKFCHPNRRQSPPNTLTLIHV